jgi:hypothetical protein
MSSSLFDEMGDPLPEDEDDAPVRHPYKRRRQDNRQMTDTQASANARPRRASKPTRKKVQLSDSRLSFPLYYLKLILFEQLRKQGAEWMRTGRAGRERFPS